MQSPPLLRVERVRAAEVERVRVAEALFVRVADACGCRVAKGGAQQLYGVYADLTTCVQDWCGFYYGMLVWIIGGGGRRLHAKGWLRV